MSDYIVNLTARRRIGGRRANQKDAASNGSISQADAALLKENLSAARDIRREVAALFNEEYYRATQPDVISGDLTLFEHFFHVGFAEGRRPNPYFDPVWYLEKYPDVREAGIQPLLHYVEYGDMEGRSPSLWFDTAWYRQEYNIDSKEVALSHFLKHLHSHKYNPVPVFDVRYYVSHNPDIVAAGVDPFIHFIDTGVFEGRNPSDAFDIKFYVNRYLNGAANENPFLHYLQHRNDPGVEGRLPENEITIPRQARHFTRPGPDFELLRALPESATRRAKLLAYYLPQFHAIPQNDAWWGTGFTEWTNVVRGMPRFAGHYQPRIPRDLGFYCLDSTEPLRRQVELAIAAGVHGFVFYYYWFNGRRLLEKPIDMFLDDATLDINFALMWANENWTRRWDGENNEILISQDYRDRDEELLLADFARHFADRRYIRLQGRPLLMIYRPGLIPDGPATFERWRQFFVDRFGENPIMVMAQGFKDTEPSAYGLDGAIEFPPHKLTEGMAEITNEVEKLDPEFSGRVLRYDDVIRASLNEKPPAFPLIRTALPSWDNDARQPGAGTVITGSSPGKYQAWLSRLVSSAVENPFFGEAVVCVNAWNEWAEGAYLEPDQHYGAAYLNATSRAVAGIDYVSKHRILLVGHDANPHGSQELLFNIGRTLRRSFGVDVEYLLLDGGPLTSRYEAIAKTTVVKDEASLGSFLAAARANGFSSAIVNTTASAHIVKKATEQDIECVVLVHELPRLIHEKDLTAGAKTALNYATKVVFPAQSVRDDVLRALGAGVTSNLTVCPQGVYKPIDYSPEGAAAVRRTLAIGPSDRLVLGVGFADLRKGFDLFIQLWRRLREQRAGIQFVWVGNLHDTLEEWLQAEIADASATRTFHVVGFTEAIGHYYSAADAFALTSREDPFPSVVLEALSAGAPVVAFDRSGGIPDMLREHKAGTVVPYGDVGAMAAALDLMLLDGPSTRADRTARRRIIDSHFQWKTYVGRLLEFAIPGNAKVSVAVPNYNYAHYLPDRLGSIFSQNHSVHEILVLDDCSTDNSLEVIHNVAADWNREIQLVPNKRNSGSVFVQWRKAARLAKGEFIWIAEADDKADPNFLSHLCAPLVADPAIRFAFADSRVMDTRGSLVGDSYKSYYATVEPAALTQSQVFEGAEFVERYLSVKNLILNASAVVWRRDALLRALDRCQETLLTFKMAGDWRLYLEALLEPGARIAYEAEPLNVHRRHGQSVTHELDGQRHVAEIEQIHLFSCDAFGLGGDIRDDQIRYAAQVAAQFGVKPEKSKSAVATPTRRAKRIRNNAAAVRRSRKG
jgi:glycosyltransferase involved in cell wall biosynthesis